MLQAPDASSSYPRFFPAVWLFLPAAVLPPPWKVLHHGGRLVRTVITGFESRPRILRPQRDSRVSSPPWGCGLGLWGWGRALDLLEFSLPSLSLNSPLRRPKVGRRGNARHTNRVEINKCPRWPPAVKRGKGCPWEREPDEFQGCGSNPARRIDLHLRRARGGYSLLSARWFFQRAYSIAPLTPPNYLRLLWMMQGNSERGSCWSCRVHPLARTRIEADQYLRCSRVK